MCVDSPLDSGERETLKLADALLFTMIHGKSHVQRRLHCATTPREYVSSAANQLVARFILTRRSDAERNDGGDAPFLSAPSFDRGEGEVY